MRSKGLQDHRSQSHLIARLKAGQLQQLLNNGGRGKEINAERSAVDRLQVELAKPNRPTASMFKAAMKAETLTPSSRGIG